MSGSLTPYEKMMAAEQEQPNLLDIDWFDASMSDEECRHSAHWMAARRPEEYKGIVRGLAMGVPIKIMAGFFKVSGNTIRVIREIEAKTLEHDKTYFLATLKRLQQACGQRLLEEIDTLDHKTLAIVLGITTDKVLLLEGQATQIVEHRTAPSVDGFRDWLAGAKEQFAQRMRDVTPPESVRSGEKDLQQGAAGSGGAAGALALGDGVDKLTRLDGVIPVGGHGAADLVHAELLDDEEHEETGEHVVDEHDSNEADSRGEQ